MPGSICALLHWLCVCRFFSPLPAKFKHKLSSGGIQGQPRPESISRLGKNAGKKAKASIILVVLCCLYCFQVQTEGFRFQESGAAFTTDSLQTLLWVTASRKTVSFWTLHCTQPKWASFDLKCCPLLFAKLCDFSEFCILKAPKVANAMHVSCRCCNMQAGKCTTTEHISKLIISSFSASNLDIFAAAGTGSEVRVNQQPDGSSSAQTLKQRHCSLNPQMKQCVVAAFNTAEPS